MQIEKKIASLLCWKW